jgi:hypothetical protein
MQPVLQPLGKLADSIVNAYLGLAAKDLAKQRLMPRFLPPFHILNNVVSAILSSQPSILPFKPRLQLEKKKLWLPEVCPHWCTHFFASLANFV